MAHCVENRSGREGGQWAIVLEHGAADPFGVSAAEGHVLPVRAVMAREHHPVYAGGVGGLGGALFSKKRPAAVLGLLHCAARGRASA